MGAGLTRPHRFGGREIDLGALLRRLGVNGETFVFGS
jgi:hypothetical protein